MSRKRSQAVSLAPQCAAVGCTALVPPGDAFCGACAAGRPQMARGDAEAVAVARERGWAALGTDEVLRAQLARMAFVDYRMLVGDDGKMLPPHEWPDEAWRVISELEQDEKGRIVKAKFEKRLPALKALAEMAGLLGARRGGADDGKTPGARWLQQVTKRAEREGPPADMVDPKLIPAPDAPFEGDS